MYLARRVIDNQLHYVLCESFMKDGCLSNRDLIHIGPCPDRFIVYGGGSSFSLSEDLLDRLQNLGVQASYEEIEHLFLPFLDPYIKNKIERFQDRAEHRSWRPMSSRDRDRTRESVHVFDRRRIFYLRFGLIDMRRLNNSLGLYRQLLDKSRDEIEQLIIVQEQELSPAEYKRYIFAIFDLRRFFKKSYARTMPQALDGEAMDHYFVEELCRLDRDQGFWRGLERTDRLPSYLIRYMVMFFDYDFPGSQNWNDFTRLFDRSRRRHRQRATSMTLDTASTVFGLTRKELAELSRKQLTALYRKLAHTLHPDKGGDHDRFIELTTAYNELLRGRR